ncbi:MAG: hypothetical protein GY711_31910 [bacterium]|nr:hypothetical protein [bacterium]
MASARRADITQILEQIKAGDEEALNQLLTDYARARGRDKRGGAFQRVVLQEELAGAETEGVDLLVLEEALSELRGLNERQAEVVELAGRGVTTVALFLFSTNATTRRGCYRRRHESASRRRRSRVAPPARELDP